MTSMVRLKKTDAVVEELTKLGFDIKNNHLSVGATALMCDVVAMSCIAFKAEPGSKSPKHQPMVALKHVAPLMLLQTREQRVAYLTEVTGRDIYSAYTNMKKPE